MDRNTFAAVGAVLGAFLGKRLYERVNEGEDAPLWIYLSGAGAGGLAGHHFAANNLGLMQALNNGSNGVGKVGAETVELLSQVNSASLYRRKVTPEVKISEVYPNEKTVGTF